MKPIVKNIVLGVPLAFATIFSAFGQNKDTLDVDEDKQEMMLQKLADIFNRNKRDTSDYILSDQVSPIERLYSVDEPIEKDGIVSVTYNKRKGLYDDARYDDQLTLRFKDGLHDGKPDHELTQDEIVSLRYLKTDTATNKAVLIKGQMTENGTDLNVRDGEQSTTKHVRKLNSLPEIRLILPNLE